ncbi:MAG: hypothetical protein FJ290_28380 [Planctomycetes bacterium]|nr:hypothetical protein [Planctomycetota bacterium]
MRHVLLAALIGLGLAAFAGEAVEVPAIRVPAPSPKLSISESFLTGLGMLPDDVKKVEAEVARLNEQRASLLKKLDVARKDLLDKQKDLADALKALDDQEKALDAFVATHLPKDKEQDYTVRKQLQPVVDWLKLKDDKVAELLTKQKAQADTVAKAREAAEAAHKALLALRDAGAPETKDQIEAYKKARDAYTTAIKNYSAATQTWLDNIESVLTDEQKLVWRTRYRRTASPLDLVPPPAKE